MSTRIQIIPCPNFIEKVLLEFEHLKDEDLCDESSSSIRRLASHPTLLKTYFSRQICQVVLETLCHNYVYGSQPDEDFRYSLFKNYVKTGDDIFYDKVCEWCCQGFEWDFWESASSLYKLATKSEEPFTFRSDHFEQFLFYMNKRLYSLLVGIKNLNINRPVNLDIYVDKDCPQLHSLFAEKYLGWTYPEDLDESSSEED